MNFSAKVQSVEETPTKRSFSFFEDSPLQSVGNGHNTLSDTYLEHKKSAIAIELEALRKATAKVHMLKSVPERVQTDQTDQTFPTQEAHQKRGGNKLRQKTVAECLKIYCEPTAKAQLYPKAKTPVRTSANGFSHQFVLPKVNNDLMDSIKSDLNKYQKYFVPKSESNGDSVYSKYFSSPGKKFPVTKAPVTSLIPTCDSSSTGNALVKHNVPETPSSDRDYEDDSYFSSIDDKKEGKKLNE